VIDQWDLVVQVVHVALVVPVATVLNSKEVLKLDAMTLLKVHNKDSRVVRKM
jgi:hypothetical protein